MIDWVRTLTLKDDVYLESLRRIEPLALGAFERLHYHQTVPSTTGKLLTLIASFTSLCGIEPLKPP